jgi:hypothetical protein
LLVVLTIENELAALVEESKTLVLLLKTAKGY